MICLDNSVLRKYTSPTAHPEVLSYLKDHAAEPWSIPASVAYEYFSYYDTPSEIRRQRRNLDELFEEIVPLTDDVAVEAALIEASLADQGITLDAADLLHAATARDAGATFVTADVADFHESPIDALLDVDVVDVS